MFQVTVRFTSNLQHHIQCDERQVSASTVRGALEAYFAAHPGARGYVVDDQGALRHHMVLFLDGRPISDRQEQSDAVVDGSELYVMQALSGG